MTDTQIVEAESAVFGCILIDVDTHEELFGMLSPKVFYTEFGQTLFEKMKKMYKNQKVVDIVTVTEDNKDLREYLGHCASMLPSAQRYMSYASIVIDNYRKRTFKNDLMSLFDKFDDNDDLNTNLSAFKKIYDKQIKISEFTEQSTAKEFSDAYFEYLDNLYNKSEEAYKSSYNNFDFMTGGFPRGEMITIAARPGKGKTDFAVNLAMRLASVTEVDYYSLEVPRVKILERIISKITKINSVKLRDKNITDNESAIIVNCVERVLNKIKLRVDDNENYTTNEIESLIIKNKPKVVFIDHIGLLKPTIKCQYQWQEVAASSLELTRFAKRYNCCIVCLVQQSSNSERNGKKELNLSDMKGSDNIGADASISMFITANNNQGQYLKEKECFDVTVTILKNRNGLTGKIYFKWMPQTHNYIEVIEREE